MLELDGAFPSNVPAAAGWAGPWSSGGGGGRPGEDANSGPELARDGGRRGPEDAEPLADGVGGLMEDAEEPTAEADDGGFRGVPLLTTKTSTGELTGELRTREQRETVAGGHVPVVVVNGVRSPGQSEEGLGFGERRAAGAVKRARPGRRGRGGDGRRQAREGRRGGRGANGLWKMLLQAFLLASFQARHPGRDHQPAGAAGAGRRVWAALAHRGAHI